jgi:D-xylose transport system substrate-binding protein
MNPRILLVVLSCVLSIALGMVLSRGGVSGEVAVRARPLIGLSMDTLKEERWMKDRDLFSAQVQALGADVMVLAANSSDSQQITDVQSMLTAKVDALVIIPHDGAAMARGVKMAHEAGVPVLSYDRLITGIDLDLYLTFDNVRVGELQAQFLADRIPVDRKLRVVRIYGSKTDNNAKLFKQGQDNVLAPLIAGGKVDVVHEDWADDWRPDNAKKITNAAITRVGTAFDAILASNDGTAGGAIQALLEANMAGKVIVTGQDADLAACQRIAGGTQTMTVYKPIKQLATRAAELAVAMAKGKVIVANDEIDNGAAKVPSILLDIVAVTRDNLRETIVADGFRSEEDVFGRSKP